MKIFSHCIKALDIDQIDFRKTDSLSNRQIFRYTLMKYKFWV